MTLTANRICAALLAVTCLTVAAMAPAEGRSASDWQMLARKDLDAVHAAILVAHPGVIDEQNPEFNKWVESGYRQAAQLTPLVVDYETLLSAVRFYTTGFRDGHLMYSDDKRGSEDTINIDGWRAGLRKGTYVVTQIVDDWPVPLPPVDSEWLGCDGKLPRAIVQENVAPFTTRLDGSEADELRADSLWIRFLPGRELHRCRFVAASGHPVELAVTYRAFKTDAFFDLIRPSVQARSSCDRHNSYERIGDATLWVHVGNFSFRDDCGDAKELDVLLQQLRQEHGFTTLVFDMRGNGGGDSSIGDRIFDAATGGLEFDPVGVDRLPRTYAQWRVSDLLISTAKRRVDDKVSLYGADSEQAADARRFLDAVEQARARGETWVEQPSGHRVTSADVAARHGKLRNFGGALGVVTDSGCVSACLDFVDLVKQVPGALQLGQTTGSDTVYIDTGSVPLPSGNHMILPLKVWRNRLRANNQAYVPDIPLKMDMRDDHAVQSATVAALAKRGVH